MAVRLMPESQEEGLHTESEVSGGEVQTPRQWEAEDALARFVSCNGTRRCDN